MEDSPPPPAPAPVIVQPPAPIGETSLEAAKGSAEGLKYLVDQGVYPQLAQQLTDIEKSQAPQRAQTFIDTQKIYGPQLTQLALDNLKRSDPSGFAIRQKLGDQTLADLDLGGALSEPERRQAQQDVRSAQVSRGLGTGLSDAIDEAAFLRGTEFNREQQRRSNAASFLAGTPPSASFAALNQAGKTAPVATQDVSGAMSSTIPSTNALIGLAGNNYGQMSANANALNNLNQQNYMFGVQNTSNPFLTGLGVAGGLAGTAARFV
jgi:hypothetical protein